MYFFLGIHSGQYIPKKSLDCVAFIFTSCMSKFVLVLLVTELDAQLQGSHS